jgi:hypothetical protein
MAVLVYVRTLIPIKHLDMGGLDQYKHPTFPALVYQGNSKWAVDFPAIDQQVQTFFAFDNYTAQAIPSSSYVQPQQQNTTPYNITQDYSGPLFDLPT